MDNGDQRLIIFDRSKDFTQEDLDKFNKHYGEANNISPQLKKYVGTNMGDAIQKRLHDHGKEYRR